MPNKKKTLTINVRDRELDYGGKGGITKREALNAYAGGFMEGVNKKANSAYQGVDSVRFLSGGTVIRKTVKAKKPSHDFNLF